MKLELFYPLKPYIVGQDFGGNGSYYQSHGINIKGHNGLDLWAAHGQPIFAAHDGLAYHEVDADSGNGVVVVTQQEYDYVSPVQGSMQAYFKTIYWHLCDYAKEPQYKSPVLDYQQKNGKKPMPVKRGELIGYADNTGFSTGDHLHFGLKPLRSTIPPNGPEDAADQDIGNFSNLEQLNGYSGAIDPTPYFGGNYARDTFYFGRNMALYATNGDVLELQKRLGVTPVSWLAYLGKGIFGPNTLAAVKAYQAENGIPTTGYVGPLTRAALNRI